VDDGSGAETSVSIARWQFGVDQAADRGLRQRAYESLNRGLALHKHTLAGTLASHIENNVAVARLRGYGSAIEMILAPGEIPESVYRMILREVHDGIMPHARRLAALRSRVLGIDRMRLYDLMAPLDPEFDPPLSFQGAEMLIRDGLAPLGKEYGALVESAFRDRWIDRADNVGKRSGAWGFSVYGAHPYVFMTWKDGWRGALTLAHEVGHACNGALACDSQIVSNAPTSSGLAFTGVPTSALFNEAPSTANEVLVGRRILETTTDQRLRRFVIEQFLMTFTHNMVTHMLEAHFEQRLYDRAEAGRPITTGDVLEAQAETFERFWGDTMEVDEHARMYWAQQVHFYLSYYSFNYSAGLTVGIGVADAIRREGRLAADLWIQTLRAGDTLSPLELARSAGVDLASPEPYRHAVEYFGQLVTELEKAYE
jgi:oligoendopeptidase F